MSFKHIYILKEESSAKNTLTKDLVKNIMTSVIVADTVLTLFKSMQAMLWTLDSMCSFGLEGTPPNRSKQEDLLEQR